MLETNIQAEFDFINCEPETKSKPKRKKKKRDAGLNYTHKTRLHVNNWQANKFIQCCGVKRVAYNWALAEWDRIYELGGKPKLYDIDKTFNSIKRDEFPWMYDVPSCVAQQAIIFDLQNAWNHFFRRVKLDIKPFGRPVPKGRRARKSFRLTSVRLKAEHIDGNRVKLPNGWGYARLGHPIRFPGKIKQTTISESGGKWYIAIGVELDERIEKAPAVGEPVGIDLGVAELASISDGRQYQPCPDDKNLEKRLVRAQRKLSRMQGPDKRTKQKPSKGWLAQKKLVAKIKRKQVGARDNYAHQISSELTAQHPLIVLEDLQIKNMTKSAKGTAEKPGKGVAQKRGLNRSIMQEAWGKLRLKIKYKAESRGSKVVMIHPSYTSQKCSNCGYTSKDNRKTQSKFKCVECSHTENADINAAKNILERGILSLSAQTEKAGPGQGS